MPLRYRDLPAILPTTHCRTTSLLYTLPHTAPPLPSLLRAPLLRLHRLGSVLACADRSPGSIASPRLAGSAPPSVLHRAPALHIARRAARAYALTAAPLTPLPLLRALPYVITHARSVYLFWFCSALRFCARVRHALTRFYAHLPRRGSFTRTFARTHALLRLRILPLCCVYPYRTRCGLSLAALSACAALRLRACLRFFLLLAPRHTHTCTARITHLRRATRAPHLCTLFSHLIISSPCGSARCA